MTSHSFYTDETSSLSKTRKIQTLNIHEQRLIFDVHQHRFQLSKENRELKQAQATLESSHKRYHNRFLNAPVGYFTFSEDGSISDANHAACRLLGVDRHHLIGGNIAGFCTPEHLPTIRKHIADSFRAKKPLTCEVTLIRSDGREIYIHAESVAVNVDNTWEAQCTMLDISERILIENALRQSERKYREIVETTQEGVWVFDSKLKISYANPRLALMLGYSVTELIGKHLFDFTDKKEIQFLKSSQSDRRRRGIREKKLIKKDNTCLWVLESTSPLVHPDGYYLGRLGMLTDISQQKKIEQALKHAQSQLEQKYQMQSTDLKSAEVSLLEQTTHRVKAEAELSRRQQALEAVYAIAIAFRGTSQSMLERVVGNVSDVLEVSYCAIAMVEGSRFSVHIQQFDGKIEVDKSSPSNSGYCGIVQSRAETVNLNRDSSQWKQHDLLKSSQYKSFLGIPITSTSGDVLGAICVLDIEPRVFSKNDIQFIEIFARYIANHIVQENMQNQLLYSQEMRVLGQLTSGVAHEVRNPLNAIVAITEALFQDMGEQSQYSPYLEHVRLQVNRLSALMQDLLDLGKPERQFNLEKKSIQSIIESSIEAWRQSSPNKNRSIQVLLPEVIQRCCLRVDTLKIQQVFSNLIDNACHHSPESSGIDVVVMSPEDDKIRIRVIDHGCGVHPEQLHRLFEPFYTTRKGGTGLGLSVVRHIVTVHSGTITVTNNNSERGLTVELTFPVLID